MTDTLRWWQRAVFYQIYPRSFADSNGDGIGDLQGIIEKLDYLQGLGVEGIWLSPHYPSPLYDCGYDVSDYTGVGPEYGTLEEFDRFLAEAHRRGMRVILDLVLNHTSDQHPWFIESRSSLDSPKRDWYIWHAGRDGGLPNNWTSIFGGPSWTLDPMTGEYYYHFFFSQQPDLNWRNPEVQEAIFDAVRFWLERGVDGFRLDAIGTLFEDTALTDHTARLSQNELYALARTASSPEERALYAEQSKAIYQYQMDQPGVHEVFQALRAVVDEYEERMLIGETEEIEYHGDGTNELHMVFNFGLMRTTRLTPAWVRANQAERLAALPPPAWPCNTLGNHDTPRIHSRYGDGKHDDALARLSLALMLTLRGTPFLYNGEEIGMTDLLLEEVGQFRDMLGVWLYHVERDVMKHSPEEAARHAAQVGRDKCRTPMQWHDAPHGGFCPPAAEPWLPVNPNFAQGVNVAEQEDDPNSLLSFYRRLIPLRQRTPALVAGDYTPLLEESESVLAFRRATDEQTCLVFLNFSAKSQTVALPDATAEPRLLFSSHPRPDALAAPLPLAPFEVLILTEG